MIVVGLTGGIASGKSYVTNYLRKLNYYVIDTDVLYKELIAPGQDCYNALIKEFHYLNSDNTLDMKKIGELVFNNSSLLSKLNSIVHPIIYKHTESLINSHKDEDIIFIDAPVLFEAHFEALCNLIVCVWVSRPTQIKRLMMRNKMDKEDAIKRIDSQMSVKEKKDKSDILLKSCLDFNKTDENINKVLERIKEYGKIN
ncbi:MAG: dephospho-CoA kinase [Acholeplasmatales bacterium]|nr:dephospho-CoA kinase [Acholeplasmatales bacterium]